jgi:putative DNA primase/helicase
LFIEAHRFRHGFGAMTEVFSFADTWLAADPALVHRLLIVDFPWIYVDDPDYWAKKEPPHAARFRKRNKFLKDEFQEMKPGILHWLVEGCMEWQEIGLKPPASVLGAVDQLADEQDYLGRFVKDCLTYSPESPDIRVACGTVHEALRWWWVQNMDDREQRVPQLKTVTAALRDQGYSVEKKGGKYWAYGVSLNYGIAKDVEDFICSREKQ